MELDTDNLPDEAEPDTLPTETEEATTEVETEDNPEGEDAEESEVEAQDSDDEEVDFDGAKYRIPKALKDAFLRQSDYTQKTQAIAEKARELDSTLERITSVSEQETQALSRVAIVEAQLQQFENIDWDAWDQTDPIAANNARWQMSEMRRAKDEAINGYHQARQQVQFVAQQETARRLEQGQKMLAERIPGWGQDKAAAILNFGQEAYGFSREELSSIDDPRAILVLHELMEARKGQKAAATKAKVQAQQAVKPAASIKGAAPVIKGLDDRLSVDDWIKRRNAQATKRR